MTYAGNLDSLKSIDTNPRYQFFKGDISNKDMVWKAINSFEPDSIINFAAESHVDRSIDGPIGLFKYKYFRYWNIIGIN